MEMRHVAQPGEMRNAHIILLGKPEGKRPFEKPNRIWNNNIKIEFKDVGCESGLDSSGSE
jgi:hypothetical protein